MGISRRGLLAASATAPVLMRASEAMAQGIAPRRGGTLQTILSPEPPVLQLGVNNQGPTGIAGSKIFQGLLEYSPTLEARPALAKSWEVSADGREYIFRLQENVKFHDGRPMTADDVIFSIMKFHMEVTPRARPILQLIEVMEARDPLTIRIVLKQAFQPFLLIFHSTTTCIVPKHLFDGQDYRQAPAVQRPVGTGPFRLAEWQRGNFIRLERFDQYWKPGQPYLDAIIYRIIPDSQSRRLAIETGQVQLTQASDIEPFDVPALRSRPNLVVNPAGWEYQSPLSWIELNHRVKPLDDARVRRAMSMAIDRNFIVNRLWFGVGKPATNPVASTTRFHDASARIAAFNVAEANRILDQAGFPRNAQGVRFTLKHMALPYGEIWTRLSEYLRQAMRNIGVNFDMESTDAGSWARRVGNWEYETTINFVYQFGDPTLGVERTYVSTNIQRVTFTNTGGYANPQVDALFQTARTSAAAADRQRAFSEVQKILVEEVPQIWLTELAFPTIHDRRLNNVITSGVGVHAPFDDVFLAG
ncbi:ABC transporter substrate-binding protein [Roseomonas sp. CECT 9278]|uniref:ABC transporter substrate-binding protein n=1 Tax=Roseomonas sp. CECT 9278 TaxID=2845823 RepID=UPI001E44EAEC|nr:ABC transporter substrate-binding protein [Roseomonas sp. CECT 9278]CAH0206502.1 Glutathione-binding protein GsiB [Roseomonas sp. CECT 9278]